MKIVDLPDSSGNKKSLGDYTFQIMWKAKGETETFLFL